MGTRLTITGADFSGVAVAFAAPVAAGLEFWNYFGGSAAKTALNFATGKAKPSIVGTPGVSPTYITLLGNTNYLVTGLVDQAEVTMLAVARPTSGDGAKYRYLIGNYNGTAGTAGGSNLYLDNAAVARPTVAGARNASGTDALQANAITSETDVSGFAFYAGRIGAAYNRVDDKTRGFSGIGPVTNPRSTPNGLPYRIGDDTTAVSTGSIDYVWAAIYSRCLSDAEVNTVYANVQSYLANNRSITV